MGDEEARENGNPTHLLRARYCFPARTTTFLRRLKSRTSTDPCVTRVIVPRHVSVTTHLVPRTVAELNLPVVRNAPLPSPHSLRVFFFAAAAPAELLAFGHRASASASPRSVIGFAPWVWPTLKMPS